jgi:hypothetical protein
VDLLDLANSQHLLQLPVIKPVKWPASTLLMVFKTFFTLVLLHFGTYLQDFFTRDELNRVLANLDATPIHFKGAGPMVTAVMGGEPNVACGAISGPIARLPPRRCAMSHRSAMPSRTTLRRLPVDHLSEAIALHPGVVAVGEDLHVRGGRSGETRVVLEGNRLARIDACARSTIILRWPAKWIGRHFAQAGEHDVPQREHIARRLNQVRHLHDTPQKGFFNETSRTFSHGCVRVENISTRASSSDSFRRACAPSGPIEKCTTSPARSSRVPSGVRNVGRPAADRARTAICRRSCRARRETYWPCRRR